MDFIETFRQSMLADGIEINDEIMPDGKIHRFHIHGDISRSKNGWYVLYQGKLPSGAYGCWKRGLNKKWRLISAGRMTPFERDLRLQRMFQAKQARIELGKQAAKNARIIWEKSLPANNTHPYLRKKNISSYGLRVDKSNHLIIPIYKNADEICSLQFISATGDKKFLKGGSINGGYYLLNQQERPTGTIYIGEGYATCSTIHKVTGYTTICAFNCGNLLLVATHVRKTFRNSKIIIAADNDAYTHGNPGLNKGKEAAKYVAADLVYPDFTGLNLESKPTDFNDLMLISGVTRVKNNLINSETGK